MILAILLALLAPMPQAWGRAEVRVGSIVVMKSKDGVRVGDVLPGGERTFRAYAVREIAGGRLRVESQGVEGWVDSAEFATKEQAVEHFTTVIHDDPHAAWAFTRRGGLLSEDPQRYDAAILDLNEAIRLDPKIATAYGLRAEIHYHRNDFNQAIADATEAIRLDPTSTAAPCIRGWAHKEKGEFDAAIADLSEAIRLDPDGAYFLSRLAWLRATCPEAKFRDGKGAVALALEAVELSNGEDGFDLETLAAAYAEAGDFTKAIETETKAVDLFADESFKADCRSRIELFKQQRMPYREPEPERAQP
jgi:tetratricopeptide (TPR) repeat protein